MQPSCCRTKGSNMQISSIRRSALACSFLFALRAVAVFGSQTQTVRIGGIFPLSHSNGQINVDGTQWLAAALMALSDLNRMYLDRGIEFKAAIRDSQEKFSKTVVDSLDLVSNVFGNNGTHIVCGAGNNAITKSVAYVLRDFSVAQIAYAANSSALSHNTDFPGFSRVFPSSSYEGVAMTDMLVGLFGYTRVVLIYTSDAYGTDGANQFTASALEEGVRIVASLALDPFEVDLMPFIEQMAVYDPRVFVLIMSSTALALRLLLLGSSVGLFSSHTVILGSGSLSSPALWMHPTDPSVGRQMMGTFFTVSYAVNDWKVSERGRAFIQRFRALPDTVSLPAADDSQVCNNQTDDDGHFYLYQSSLTGLPPFSCLGNIYSSLAADGSDIHPSTAYSYDAVMAAGMGVVAYADLHNQGAIPMVIDGAMLKAVLVSNVMFPGYSSDVAFSGGRPHLLHYGAGDRTQGVRYAVSNFNLGNGSVSASSMRRIGTWTLESGYIPCALDASLQSAVTGSCATIRYGTSDNSKPSDRPETIHQQIPPAIQASLSFLAAVNLILIGSVMYLLVAYRRARLLKATQPSMMWVVTVANVFCAFRSILAALPASRTVCCGNIWMGHLAFMSVVAMFAKTLRIFLLVKSGLRRKKITSKQVLIFTGMVSAVYMLYLLCFSLIAPPSVITLESFALNGQVTISMSCDNSQGGFNAFLYAIEGGVLVASALLCYITRDVPDAINESQVISLALLLILVVSTVGFSLTLLLDLRPYEREFVVGLCFFLSSAGSLGLYFGKKAHLLLSGAEMNGKFEIIRAGQFLREGFSHRALSAQSFSDTSCEQKTAVECEAQIKVLKTQLMKILAQEAYTLMDATGSFKKQFPFKTIPVGPKQSPGHGSVKSSKITPLAVAFDLSMESTSSMSK